MRKKADCNLWKIYSDDCMDVFPKNITASVDAVITDPPYILASRSGCFFWGCENDPKWYDLASARVAAAYSKGARIL